MPNLLSPDTIRLLTDALVPAGLAKLDARDELLQGIHAGFAADLPSCANMLDQVRSDLTTMNQTPTLSNGQVPLQVWLTNAVSRLKRLGRVEATTFQSALDKLAAALSRPQPFQKQVPDQSAGESPGNPKRPRSKRLRRVCFVSSEYSPNVIGGLGVHVTELTRALGNRLDVDVVLPSSRSSQPYDPYPPRVHLRPVPEDYPVYGNEISWLEFAVDAAEQISRMASKGHRPDVIHCHDWVTVLAGVLCRQRLGIPLVFHVHLPNQRGLCASIEDLGLYCADLITVSSEFMKKELKRRGFPRNLQRLEVVQNGVDWERFRPCDDWPNDGGYILFVGRLVEQKGLEFLVRALFFVKEQEQFSNVKLKIVGTGELQPRLKRLSASLMLSDRIEFVGWKTGPELVGYYQKASIVVVPSVYEPFGMTALEAMSCQRPVIASNVGGLKDIVVHNGTGFLAEARDYLDLAQCLMALLDDSKLRESLGKSGRDRISQGGYLWDKTAKRYIDLYKSLQGKEVSEAIVPEDYQQYKAKVIEDAEEMDADPMLLDRLRERMP